MPNRTTLSRTIARRILSTVVLCGFVHCGAIASAAPLHSDEHPILATVSQQQMGDEIAIPNLILPRKTSSTRKQASKQGLDVW